MSTIDTYLDAELRLLIDVQIVEVAIKLRVTWPCDLLREILEILATFDQLADCLPCEDVFVS